MQNTDSSGVKVNIQLINSNVLLPLFLVDYSKYTVFRQWITGRRRTWRKPNKAELVVPLNKLCHQTREWNWNSYISIGQQQPAIQLWQSLHLPPTECTPGDLLIPHLFIHSQFPLTSWTFRPAQTWWCGRAATRRWSVRLAVHLHRSSRGVARTMRHLRSARAPKVNIVTSRLLIPPGLVTYIGGGGGVVVCPRLASWTKAAIYKWWKQAKCGRLEERAIAVLSGWE